MIQFNDLGSDMATSLVLAKRFSSALSPTYVLVLKTMRFAETLVVNVATLANTSFCCAASPFH